MVAKGAPMMTSPCTVAQDVHAARDRVAELSTAVRVAVERDDRQVAVGGRRVDVNGLTDHAREIARRSRKPYPCRDPASLLASGAFGAPIRMP